MPDRRNDASATTGPETPRTGRPPTAGDSARSDERSPTGRGDDLPTPVAYAPGTG